MISRFIPLRTRLILTARELQFALVGRQLGPSGREDDLGGGGGIKGKEVT